MEMETPDRQTSGNVAVTIHGSNYGPIAGQIGTLNIGPSGEELRSLLNELLKASEHLDAGATAEARDTGKIGFGRHTNYYGSAVYHQSMHRLGYHAYQPDCASSIGEESKYPPWSFC